MVFWFLFLDSKKLFVRDMAVVDMAVVAALLMGVCCCAGYRAALCPPPALLRAHPPGVTAVLSIVGRLRGGGRLHTSGMALDKLADRARRRIKAAEEEDALPASDAEDEGERYAHVRARTCECMVNVLESLYAFTRVH